MASNKRPVGASVVREWFSSLAEADRVLKVKGADDIPLSIGQRGKLSDDVITAFEKANRGKVYMAGHVEPRKITAKVSTSNGRSRTVNVTATLSEVRAWAQSPEAKASGINVGARGRISEDVYTAFATRPGAAPAAKVSKPRAPKPAATDGPVPAAAAANVTDVTV